MNHYIAQYPDIKITVACGNLVADFFRVIPQVETVIDIRKQSWKRHWVKLWREVVRTQWDIVVDVRNSAVSRTIMARKKYVFGAHVDQSAHKVEQMAQIIGVSPPPAPKLWFDGETYEKAMELVPSGEKILAVGPSANWQGKTWPADKFIELIARLRAKGAPFHGWRVAVIAAPGEEKQAEPVLKSIHHSKRIDLIAKTSPLQAAACLSRCDFYIGNDSGLMHAAAVVGIPTLGLFGPSWPHIYRPWGPKAAYVSTKKNFDELIDYDGYTPQTAPSLMTSLSVTKVETAALKLLRSLNS